MPAPSVSLHIGKSQHGGHDEQEHAPGACCGEDRSQADGFGNRVLDSWKHEATLGSFDARVARRVKKLSGKFGARLRRLKTGEAA